MNLSAKRMIATIEALIITIVAATPLFYFSRSVYPNLIPKTLFFQILVEFLVGCYIILAVCDHRYRPKINAWVIATAVFLGILSTTALFGIDPWRSFWSIQDRMFGIVTWAHCIALSWIISWMARSLRWNRIFFFLSTSAAVVSILAFIQLWIPDLLLNNEQIGDRPGSTLGNPAFLAGYLLVVIVMQVYVLLRKPEHEVRSVWYYLIFTSLLINVAALFNTRTRGDILALAAAGLVAIFYWALYPPQNIRLSSHPLLRRRSTYLGLIGCFVLFSSLLWYTKQSSLWNIIPGIDRLRNTTLAAADLAPRLAAWSAATSGIKERPLSGFGWENFNIVFNKYYDPKVLSQGYQETRFDKPHNVPLEYAVTGGLSLLLSYAGIFAALIYHSRKNKKDELLTPFTLSLVAGYTVRNLFVFETLGIVLVFMVAAGFIASRAGEPVSAPPAILEKNTGGNNKKNRQRTGIHPGVAAATALSVFFVVYVLNIRSMYAAYEQFLGLNYFINNKIPQSLSSFQEAIATPTPWTWNFKRDYAAAVAQAYFYHPDSISPDQVRAGIAQMEEVAREHGEDSYNHYILVDMYNQVSDIDPDRFLTAAEHEAKLAMELSPNRQEIYFSLAKTKTLQKDYAAALALLDKTLELAPGIPDAHFYYGLVSYASNQPARGYQEIKTALGLGRAWKNYNEPLVVGNFFADSGHLDEAIELYKTALSIQPGDQESQVKLAIAYFLKGDRDAARSYIRELMKKFDLTQSPSYGELAAIMRDLGL